MARFKECLKICALLVVCVGVPTIAWVLMRIERGAPDSRAPNPTYAELVAIVLTGVTVVLAVLAIVIAILAIWGYQSIKAEAGALARSTVQGTVDTELQKKLISDALDVKIDQVLVARIESKATEISAQYVGAFGATAGDAAQSSISAEYPKDGGGDAG